MLMLRLFSYAVIQRKSSRDSNIGCDFSTIDFSAEDGLIKILCRNAVAEIVSEIIVNVAKRSCEPSDGV